MAWEMICELVCHVSVGEGEAVVSHTCRLDRPGVSAACGQKTKLSISAARVLTGYSNTFSDSV